MATMRRSTFASAALLVASIIALADATCPVEFQTPMEHWDMSPWNGRSAVFHNSTETTSYNVTLCQFAFSQTFDLGNFDGETTSMQYHDPTDTFYLNFKNGDQGSECMGNPRQSDVFVYCQGCPAGYECSSFGPGKTCICAAWTDGCTTNVHMTTKCPEGVPHYRQKFDVYDASTGIAADVSKVIVKDGEVMPSWKDVSTPEVTGTRAVIPSTARKAVFYLMMEEGSTETTTVGKPDVFTDQKDVLDIVTGGDVKDGGVVTSAKMSTLELDFKCKKVGLAQVHVEVAFNGLYYPSDFAFTYECENLSSGWTPGGTFLFTFIMLGGVGFVGMCAYNYVTLGKRGRDIIPFVDVLEPIALKIAELVQNLVSLVSSKLRGNEYTYENMGGSSSEQGPSQQQSGFQESDSSFRGII